MRRFNPEVVTRGFWNDQAQGGKGESKGQGLTLRSNLKREAYASTFAKPRVHDNVFLCILPFRGGEAGDRRRSMGDRIILCVLGDALMGQRVDLYWTAIRRRRRQGGPHKRHLARLSHVHLPHMHHTDHFVLLHDVIEAGRTGVRQPAIWDPPEDSETVAHRYRSSSQGGERNDASWLPLLTSRQWQFPLLFSHSHGFISPS